MRLLVGRPVPTQGRQPEIATAPAVHLPTLSVSQTGQFDGEHTCVPRSPSGAVHGIDGCALLRGPNWQRRDESTTNLPRMSLVAFRFG